ncbi:DNA-binding CsgD family transcriptional regulator/sugar-specific transcriptional regulator TrmB [Streptomyces griseochromogenes]|uniref:DNA-binding CsgD family transcriptional regulator/sugar-specific transcriptional regulator TrmB n=1 Tax=Streptomyces griseochromogenes TaxID=68214 RepID=A0A1B1APF6_9ACTN|nr:helix-turn-helix transcriptional regulator [Streptomyces griseochromogenes]ANP48467.1 helix-turn-helix transcriptional regulator [Streptomyces griseochromogenes]MBP2052863.1 DNA-binding CsgD family transcriptional regulator/sugar-specific transcriptional regulator TrmB [Streptomyces griseochromogenes]
MSHPEHGPGQLCEAGATLYERALRDGRLQAGDAADAPCLIGSGLLRPAPGDPGLLEPVTPTAALHRLLGLSAARIAAERRRQERLVEQFEPLTRIETPAHVGADTPVLRLHSGTERINRAITEAMADASEEVLTIQSRAGLTGRRGEAAGTAATARDQAVLDRGARMRGLYQHTLRHVPAVYAGFQRLQGDVEARALDELPDRLIVIDRTVVFVPAGDDGRIALEVRHPALLRFFVTAFDRLWRLATPIYPQTVKRPTLNGVTPRQRAIAGLLVEGLTDAAVAERLGMNIRTARVHIAKLAAVLGSESRAQLGYLIARSGILDQEP